MTLSCLRLSEATTLADPECGFLEWICFACGRVEGYPPHPLVQARRMRAYFCRWGPIAGLSTVLWPSTGLSKHEDPV